MRKDTVRIAMLIQCDYGCDDFLVRNQIVYYKGVKISPVNPTPVLSVGEYELYIISGIFPLECSWLVIIQSRYPQFYKCRKVEMEGEKVTLSLIDDRQLRVKPYRDGSRDRLLIDQVYAI